MNPVKLTVDGASAQVVTQGAHVTSWHTRDGVERLFLSQQSDFRAGAAIRGGVPIIFPQFAGLGPLPKHGFARTAQWQLHDSRMPDTVQFRLQDSDATRALWPHVFSAEYSVTLAGEALVLALSVRNTGAVPYSFTAALHTYLRVTDIEQVRLKGLQGLRYSDTANGGRDCVEADPVLAIRGEVDRIYFSSKQPIILSEPGQRDVVCSATGFADTVVWNPGPEKAAALADLEPGGYRHMVCIEAAAIGAPITLAPQASWRGEQRLSLAQPPA